MRWTVGTNIGSAFALTLVIFVIVGAVSYRSTNALIESSRARQRAYEALAGLSDIQTLLRDVEIGARSYALTGR